MTLMEKLEELVDENIVLECVKGGVKFAVSGVVSRDSDEGLVLVTQRKYVEGQIIGQDPTTGGLIRDQVPVPHSITLLETIEYKNVLHITLLKEAPEEAREKLERGDQTMIATPKDSGVVGARFMPGARRP